MGLAKGERAGQKREVLFVLEPPGEQNMGSVLKFPQTLGLASSSGLEGLEVDSYESIDELRRVFGIPPRKCVPALAIDEQQAVCCPNGLALPTAVDIRTEAPVSMPNPGQRVPVDRRDEAGPRSVGEKWHEIIGALRVNNTAGDVVAAERPPQAAMKGETTRAWVRGRCHKLERFVAGGTPDPHERDINPRRGQVPAQAENIGPNAPRSRASGIDSRDQGHAEGCHLAMLSRWL